MEEMEPMEGALFLLRRLRVLKKGQPIKSAPHTGGGCIENSYGFPGEILIFVTVVRLDGNVLAPAAHDRLLPQA